MKTYRPIIITCLNCGYTVLPTESGCPGCGDSDPKPSTVKEVIDLVLQEKAWKEQQKSET